MSSVDVIDRALPAVTLIAAVGSGLIAGVFFAFSSFVMRALAKLPPADGLAAMQSVNVVVISPLFMAVFLGTAALCLALPFVAWWRWPVPGGGWVLAGCALYLVGTFGVTVVGNVPLNDAIAPLDPADPASHAAWLDYLRDWTRWNHVRTVAATAALASFVLSIRR